MDLDEVFAVTPGPVPNTLLRNQLLSLSYKLTFGPIPDTNPSFFFYSVN